MSTFSIIMPVYNAEKVLAHSIESVLGQTIRDFELIVIDDGSTDKSLEVLHEYASKDCRIVVLHQKNAGPGSARNYGLKNCSGEFITFLDSDDYWENDFLEYVMLANPEGKADLIFIDKVKEREDGTVIKYLNVYSHRNLSRKEMICSQMTGKIPWGTSKVIRKDLLDKVGGQFLDLSVGEETIFSYEVLKNAQKVSFVSKPIYHYVQSSTGQHKKGDFDPWGPMVFNLKNHLIKTNDYVEYESTVNSLAVKAVSISIYRYSCEMSMACAIKGIKEITSKYMLDYDFDNVNLEVLDKSSLIILALLKCKWYFPLVLASRYRKKKLAY